MKFNDYSLHTQDRNTIVSIALHKTGNKTDKHSLNHCNNLPTISVPVRFKH